jgi:Leucine-rich repeat (LRR) protein
MASNQGPSTNKKSKNNSRKSAMSSARKQFSFNLPNLKKVDLSYNKLKNSFSIYSAFALSSNLVELNLSANRIAQIDMSLVNDKSNLKWALEIMRQHEQKQQLLDEEQIKQFRVPTFKLNNLRSINLSNNEIKFDRGGFVKMLCNIYKFAPNLNAFVYDQLNGARLGEPPSPQIEQTNTNSGSNEVTRMNTLSQNASNANNPSHQTNDDLPVSDDFYFDFDEFENDFVTDLAIELNDFDMLMDQNGASRLRRNEFYERLLDQLNVIDMSNNSLKTLPKFIYQLKNLKEIYFNGNLLSKIPIEMYTQQSQSQLDDDDKFEHLKQLQSLRIKAENDAKRRAESHMDDDEDAFEDHEEEEEKKPVRKSNRKQKGKSAKKDQPKIEDQQAAATAVVSTNTVVNAKPLSDTIEVIHFNSNKIEHVPENLFSNFKQLKEIKLLNNPLREPPIESVCVSSRFVKNKNELDMVSNSSNAKTLGKIRKLASKEYDEQDISDDESEYSNYKTTTIQLLDNKTNRMDKTPPVPGFDSLLALNSNAKNSYSSNGLALPNLFFETNENLKPLQSYMIKYKNREGNSSSLIQFH